MSLTANATLEGLMRLANPYLFGVQLELSQPRELDRFCDSNEHLRH